MFPKRYDEFMNLVDPYSPGLENVREVDCSANRKLLCLLNTRYILTSKKITAPDLQLIFDGDVKIYEDLKVLPRAFIVPQAKIIKGKKAIFEELCSDGFDPERCVILEEMPDMVHAETLRRGEMRRERGSSARIIKYAAEKVTIKATVTPQQSSFLDKQTETGDSTYVSPANTIAPPFGGFLVLSDTYYPGWQVFVDGKKCQLLCADYTLRAVYLTQGEHLVEFEYSPFSFRLGSAISIVCLIIMVSLFFLYFLRVSASLREPCHDH